jgi:hypothetical protein
MPRPPPRQLAASALRSMPVMSRFWILLPFGVAACATTATRDDATRAAKVVPSWSPAPTAPESDDAGAIAPPPTSLRVTKLYPVVEGACPNTRAYAVGKTPVLVMYRDAWAMGADEVHPLHRMGPPVYDRMSGTVLTADHIGDVGGVDEEHAWVQLRLSTGRTEDMSHILLRTPEWRRLPTPQGHFGFFGLSHVIPQPDGGLWAYGIHSMYLDIPGDDIKNPDANHDKYFAWSAGGEPLKINLPGPDMKNAVRSTNGELLAAGRTAAGKPVLRRWSPVKKVDDLVLANEASGAVEPTLALGTSRAVLLTSKQEHAFYDYVGEKLQKSPLSSRVRDVASWLLTNDDDLMVTTASGALFIETKDGTIFEERLPGPGRLAGESSAAWLIASGALYTRGPGREWSKLTLPDETPWGTEPRPPSRIEWVKRTGDETWVSAVRTDVGFGLRKPAEVRTFYSSKPRPQPLRCGAPFPSGTIAGYPPRASASCTDVVVVVATELEREQKTDYPKLGAALKGNVALGESLRVVGFGAGPNRLLGIAAPTPEIAKELTKKLTGVAPHVPEVVCGSPNVQRRLRFDVKSGTFSNES